MDVFTETVNRILEDITSAALGPNSGEPFDKNTEDNATFPYNNILGMKEYKSVSKRRGKKPKKIAVQRRTLNTV